MKTEHSHNRSRSRSRSREQHFLVFVDEQPRVFSETNLRMFMQYVLTAGVSDEDFELQVESLSDALEGDQKSPELAIAA